MMLIVFDGFGVASKSFNTTTSPVTDALLELVFPRSSEMVVRVDAARIGAPPPRETPPELVFSKFAGTNGSVDVRSVPVLSVVDAAALELVEVPLVPDVVVVLLPVVLPVEEPEPVVPPVPVAPVGLVPPLNPVGAGVFDPDPLDEDEELPDVEDEFPLPEVPLPDCPASP